ncbi:MULTISPECIES: Fe-S cluster assembly protein SufD [unclassified Thalassolituus]|uniref:Fe-S cluster assembly protein SufD n=1 Tax=unclassified Thalassolituus TaxID=2624967 RepID=UPI0025FCEA48|nr:MULTISPECIES: Fe-S cluster assembly protein SufD [unclassified Thalassolituus]|tara:strand:+ start:973 stop:2316 length:1344 start_codon:yes stop_codon:yes gene_type:complete
MAEQFILTLLQQAERTAALPLLSELNQKGQTAFAQAVLPNRKTEAWKYTPLTKFAAHEYAQPGNSAVNDELAASIALGNIDAAKLVFINGQFKADLSDALEEATLFSQANEAQQELIRSQLGSQKAGSDNEHLFNDLNDAAVNEGVLVHVGKNSRPAKPVQVVWLTTEDAAPFMVTSRLLVVLETGAELTLIEQYDSDDAEQVSFTNAVTELAIGDNAKLQHYRLQMMQEQAQHIGSVFIGLNRDSQYNAFHLALGSNLTRNDVVVNHNVGGSHCEINGVYIPQNEQVVDFHTCIEHKVPNCTSDEVFRGIMNDKSKAVFNGRIHIHPQAQKTLAELSNKNLLLTNSAEVNTKPELEIYADDVKCAHGATVAQLEEKARFYLQSRGVSKREAEVMLSFGFINELLEALPDEAITRTLRPVLARRFGRDQSLSRHLLEGVDDLTGEQA